MRHAQPPRRSRRVAERPTADYRLDEPFGEADPALKVTTFGEIARRAARVEHIQASWQPGRDLMPAMRSGDRSANGRQQDDECLQDVGFVGRSMRRYQGRR